MADRLYAPNMFSHPIQGRQQPMLSQGPQQPQLDPQQSVSGLPNQTGDRMWQQMQNQQMQNQQLQSQFPSQLPPDFPNSQPNQPQMMDILRRNLNFPPSQAPSQKPPQQPQFGLGGQMDPSHSFNDSQPGQGFPQQLPAGFTSNAQLQQVLAARNQNMALGPQARQLDLLLAQNQQNNQQSAPFNYAGIRQFQQQSQPHSQPQMQQVHTVMGMPMQAGQMGQQGAFIGAGIQNAQHQVQNGVSQLQLSQQQQQQHQQQQQQQQQQAQSRRPMTFQEIRDRALVVQSTIKDMENEISSIPRHGKSDAEYVADITKARQSLLGRKQLLAKLFQAMQMMTSQGLERVSMEWVIGLPLTGPSLTHGNNSNLNIPSSSPAPPPQPPMAHGNQPWLQRPGSSAANGFVNPQQQPGQQQMPTRSPQVPTSQGAIQQNPQSNRPILPPQIPNRSVPTPLQMLNASAQAAPQGSPRPPSMLANNQFSQTPSTATAAAAALNPPSANPSVPVIFPRTPFQPLNAQMFQTLFAKWCAQHKLVKDDALTFEGRAIDLYALHTAVMRAGGVQRVNQTDHWPIIGAQLGFIQLPGTGNEPPRSGPQMAQRLMNVYEKYLHQFDVAYMRSLVQRLAQMQNGGQPVQNMHNGQGQPPMNQSNNGMVNHMPGGPNGLNVQGAQPQPPQARSQMPPLVQLSQMTGINDPGKLNELIQLSMHPAEQLRARGINEGVINMVELHRALLQRFFQAQKNFRDGVKNNAAASNPLAAAANTMANQRQLMMANNGTLPPQNQMMNGQPSSGQMMPPNSNPTPNSQPGMGMRPGVQQTGMPGANGVVNGQQRMSAVQQQQAHQQQQQQQQGQVGQQQKHVAPAEGPGPGRPVAIPRSRPSAEDMQRATAIVHNMHKEFQQRTAAMNFRFIELPEQQRLEYNKTFEQLYRYASDVQDKLPVFACYLQEDMLRKLFTMLYSTTQQRAFLSAGNPKYFMNLEQIRGMCRHLQLAVDRYNSLVTGVSQQQHPQPSPQQQHPTVPTQNLHPPVHPSVSNAPHVPQNQQVQHAPPLPQRNVQQPPHPTPNQTPGHVRGSTPHPIHSTPVLTPATKKKPIPLAPGGSPAAVSTPPASAATPASAPTPTHLAASPQTPKSPKVRGTPKAKAATKRKPSIKASAPPPVPAAGPSATPAATSPAPPPVAAATPKPPSTSAPETTGTKRRREEEPASAEPAVSIESPPKKAKVEPEEPMSVEQAKRKQEAAAIDSQDDALKFFETMTDLMKSQDTLPFEFTEGLDNLIKGCGVPELPETGSSLGEGSGENGSGGTGQGSHGGGSSILDGLEFFDFSSYGLDDDHESKAATPDLVPTSSTNPSPSSGSEVDAAHGGSMSMSTTATSTTTTMTSGGDTAKIVDLVKSEEDPFDPTRLGPFQEVDNGESSYYSDFGSWKWEGTMSSSDAPWAFLP